ncbi:7a-methyl-1,5-dioxo-octahydro-1H-inden-4-yl [Seminavis robusta]|uniref:7a-methyl-1,5-dioxo-octahydro-1H-inden-4-yl n=1 Tax=Seminavis robusta TaxID=568900 RepID=A0A9N8DVL7_9STRA|nr:7a-methyl-1,5-dioxo-octahydro-1H-inden-4-yl [Seminavis robusta]|eukprot:Sro309_g113710.1 7a-methyl-1,5-dioxo-octahydro-1H-inden-4-yl (687) ;mRNA; r:13326-15651
MASTTLRTLTLRRLLRPSRSSLAAIAPTRSFSGSSNDYVLSEHEQKFYDKGWLDERGLTQFKTLHENQVRACQIFADRDLYGVYSDETEKFEFSTYRDFGQQVDLARHVLKDLGVGPGDKVALIANNRWEWAAIACAAYSLTAGIVPMYEAQLPSDWSYIVNDSQAKVLFCATQEIYDSVKKDVAPSAPTLQTTMCLDAPEGEPHAFATAMAAATEDAEGKLILEPTVDDLASLIYTSGTTGKPKGVELTHNNISTNVIGAARTMVENPHDFINPHDRSLAFLPWAHSYGQTCELWLGIAHGCSAGICRGVPFILEDLQHVKPSALFAVPTLYKKVYDGVNNVMETANPRRKYLMQRALELGSKNAAYQQGRGPALGFMENLTFKALDSIVLSKIRARFGGNLKHAFVAGAACPAEVIKFMDSLGIMVLEGYGLTETSPIITINSPEQRFVGAVGRPIGDVKVHIMGDDGKELGPGQDGEICCTGPNIMKGYYNNPEATNEVISVAPDGVSRMFHTGDMGQFTEDGFVKVTGRIKEQYKLENGKYVVPTPIEEAIGMSRFITQVVLVGANRPHNVVLIVPEWEALRTEFQVSPEVTEEELANDERVKELIDAEIQMSCYNLKKFEIPTKFAFVSPFTVANDMLTPKMSIRRHKVQETYKDLIVELYGTELESEANNTNKEPKEKAA